MPDDVVRHIEIRLIKTADEKDLVQLLKEAGWWTESDDLDRSFLTGLVTNSALFAGAFYKEKMVGMGRVLSDLVSDAYIQDVTVLKEYRGKCIGKKIVQLLVDELKNNKVDWIGLVAEPGTSSFYDSLGFEQLKDHIPFKYRNR